MSNHDHTAIVATDLPITLYLNQRLTFDLLAALQGGFSSFATVQTTSSEGAATKASGVAQLGASNVFALLGVRLGGDVSRQAGQHESESTTQEIIHTPASLFAQLRKQLHELKLVRYVESTSQLGEIHPSEFVEFEATLRRSPLVEMLDSFAELMQFVGLADQESGSASGQVSQRKQRRSGKGQGRQDNTAAMIESLRSAVTIGSSRDLIAEMGSMRVILSTDQDYFVDPSMNDTVDGTFRIFGKATRVIHNNDETISLLRKSVLGKFGNVMESLVTAMKGVQESGFDTSVEIEIPGPTMQVIPIAIFS